MAKGKHLRIQTELFPDRFTSTFTKEPDEILIKWIEETWSPLSIDYLRKDFDTFYATVLRNTKNKVTREHLIEYKERFVFTFLSLLTKDLVLNLLYEQYKNHRAGLEMIYGMEFDKIISLTNIAFAGLIGDLDYLEKLKLMDRKKYPDELFEKANEIYEMNYSTPEKLSYDEALAKAVILFSQFENIDTDGTEFLKIIIAYKQWRSRRYRKK